MMPVRISAGSFIYCFTTDGYPALVVAFCKTSTVVLASLNVTTASFLSRLAATFSTPSTFFNALLTVMGHASQSMPGTLSVTVLLSAYAGGSAANPTKVAPTNTIERSFIMLSLVKEAGGIRKNQCDYNHRRHHPEHHSVDSADLRNGTESPRLARFGRRRRINLPVGEHHADKRNADGVGTIRLERHEVRDPCTADAHGDQHQRAEATDGGDDRRERAAHQRCFLKTAVCHRLDPKLVVQALTWLPHHGTESSLHSPVAVHAAKADNRDSNCRTA